MRNCLMFFRSNPSPPPAFQNLHKIEEDTSEEGQCEDMEQESSSPSALLNNQHRLRTIIPPNISVTDEQGRTESHTEFPRYPPDILILKERAGPLSQRSRTFNTLQDAYIQNVNIHPAQELHDVSNGVTHNGIFSNICKSLENICAKRISNRDTDAILVEVRRFLDSRDINYELSPDHSVKLIHPNTQLKMEVVQSGHDTSDLRFRHMSGDSLQSRQLCNELLQYMSL